MGRGCLEWLLALFLLWVVVSVWEWLTTGGFGTLGRIALVLVLGSFALLLLLILIGSVESWWRSATKKKLSRLAPRSAADAENYRRFLEQEEARERAAQVAVGKKAAPEHPHGPFSEQLSSSLVSMGIEGRFVTHLAGGNAFVALRAALDGLVVGRVSGEGTLEDVRTVSGSDLLTVAVAASANVIGRQEVVRYGAGVPIGLTLVVVTRSPEQPMWTLAFTNEASAKEWHARIGALINPGPQLPRYS